MELSFNFWKKLCNFWTILLFTLVIFDFFYPGKLAEILDAAAFIYVAVLSVYVSKKEFERWYHKKLKKHLGEIFVIIWTILISSVLVVKALSSREYQLPFSVISSYVAVLTILALSKKSKNLYNKKK